MKFASTSYAGAPSSIVIGRNMILSVRSCRHDLATDRRLLIEDRPPVLQARAHGLSHGTPIEPRGRCARQGGQFRLYGRAPVFAFAHGRQQHIQIAAGGESRSRWPAFQYVGVGPLVGLFAAVVWGNA